MKNKRKKYDAKYISYVENGDSAAVFITRDIVKSINTEGKWIDVIRSEGGRKIKEADYRWDFKSFVVELFPRVTKPVYPKKSTEEEKKYITWATAAGDIENWRFEGYRGRKYKVRCKLIKIKNEWKYKILSVERIGMQKSDYSGYQEYLRTGYSEMEDIMREKIFSVNTVDNWIDIVSVKSGEDFKSFIAELFPKTITPDYSQALNNDDRKYITWETARKDIAGLKREGWHGQKYEVKFRLVNKNQGKNVYTLKKVLWNRKLEMAVPEALKTAECEYREVKVPVPAEPDWQYEIISVERLGRKKKEYESYVGRGYQDAVAVMRDVVHSVNTDCMWIDVISIDGERKPVGAGVMWDFKSFVVELFLKKTEPDYSQALNEEDRKYITWETAQKDIFEMRSKGRHGRKYEVKLELVREGGGYTLKKALWNRRLEMAVPEALKTPECEYREVKVPVPQKWHYEIISVKKL